MDYTATGGMEIVFTFGGATVDPDEVERAVPGSEVNALEWERQPAVRVRIALEPPDDARREVAVQAVRTRAPTIESARWSGDRLFLRATADVGESVVRDALASSGFETLSVDANHDEGTGEQTLIVRVSGQDTAIERAVERALDVDAVPESVQTVGPQRKTR